MTFGAIEHASRRIAQLVRLNQELHAALPVLQVIHRQAVLSRGIPRMRSEMMFRWISLLPPAMVHMKEFM